MINKDVYIITTCWYLIVR